MIRRSRISVRPNVRPASRPLSASRDTSQDDARSSGSPSATSRDPGPDESTAAPAAPAEEPGLKAELQNSGVVPQPASDSPVVHVGAQTPATSSPSTVGTQRRKRFAVLPNLAKPRTAPALAPTPNPAPAPTPAPAPAPTPSPSPSHTSSKTLKSPVKSASSLELRSTAPTTTSPNVSLAKPFDPQASPSGPLAPPSAPEAPSDRQVHHSPRRPERRRPSGVGRKSTHPPLLRPVPPSSVEETHAVSLEQEHKGTPETLSASQEAASSYSQIQKSVESQQVPSEQRTVMQEKKECVMSEQGELSACSEKAPTPPSLHRPSAQVPLALRTLNDPGDRLRLARAKKLRELLKKEMNKDKLKQQRPKMGSKEPKAVKDHTKMTMRELIYYLPSTNPMTSYAEDDQGASETVLPSSPKPTPAPPPASPPQPAQEAEEEEESVVSRAGEEEPLLAPRVKVAEDGSLIIDEESLTVEVLRVTGPNPADDRDPIFERGSTTTYSSFRKGTYTKPWSSRETDMFFLAISMVGTDFSMISQLFPHRARIEIKNKFKKEERSNSWRIDKAFKERRRLDLEFFRDLLGKILKDEDNKRKKKRKKNSVKLAQAQCAARSQPGARKRNARSSCSEEESSGSDVMEGEKENEDMCVEGGLTGAPSRSRRKIAGASPKKSRPTKTAAEDEGDGEDSTSEDQAPVDRSQEHDWAEEKGESSAVQVKGGTQRLLVELGRRWGSRGPVRSGQDPGTTVGGQRTANRLLEEEERRYTSDIISCGLADSEEEEESDLSAIQEHIFNKPTRSGRIPKLSQHVMRAAAEEDEDEEEGPSTLPRGGGARGPWQADRRARGKPGATLTRGMPRQGKARLVTLLASTTEGDEEEEEEEEELCPATVEEENQPFVPLGLRAVAPVSVEVEETMEELDISVNVPDVLGITHNAVCPESSCGNALSTAGSVPCEHQLGLLVDVIEFLTPDHMEVSEESYAEAARTLLTIGHGAHVTPTAEPIVSCADHVPPSEEPIASNAAHVTSTAEPISTDDDIIFVQEGSTRLLQQEVQQEVVLETTDQSEARPETSLAETSEPCVILDSSDGPDPVGHVCEGDLDPSGAPEPTIQQDSISMEEPIISQETDHSIHHLTPKPNLLPVPRQETAPEPHPAVNDQLLPVAPPQGATEARMVETPPHAEDLRDCGETSSMSTLTIPAGLQEALSTPDRTVSRSSGLPAETTSEGGASAGVLQVEEQRVEVGEQQLEVPHSVSESQTGSVQPSRVLRRFRGSKPKPNVVQRSRPCRTQTQSIPSTPTGVPVETTFTDTQRTEGGAHATAECHSQNTTQEGEIPVDAEMEKAGEVCEEAVVRSLVEPSGSMAGIVSVDLLPEPDHSLDEPIFILSLTEVPPTVVKEAEHGADFLATSELVSEPLSDTFAGAPGPDGGLVSHLLLPELLMPVSEDQETGGESRENKAQSEEENPVMERPSKQCVEPLSSVAEVSSEEMDLPATPPERTRRAKVQVRPNPVQRRRQHGLQATEPPSSSLETTPLETTPLETTPLETPLAVIAPPATSLKEASSALVPNTAVITERTKTPPTPPLPFPSLVTSMQRSEASSPPSGTDTPPESASEASSSQSIMGRMDLQQAEEMETVGIEDTEASGSGAESQPVRQITPVTTTGPPSRPARRPRGFLSFMSSASTRVPARTDQKRTTPGPVTSAGRMARRATPSPAPPPTPPSAPPQQSENSGMNPHAVEEPTSVSAYFFNDIFTIVDELEMLDSKD